MSELPQREAAAQGRPTDRSEDDGEEEELEVGGCRPQRHFPN